MARTGMPARGGVRRWVQSHLWGAPDPPPATDTTTDEPDEPAVLLDQVRGGGVLPGQRRGGAGQITGPVRRLRERDPLPPLSVPVRVRGVDGLWACVEWWWAGRPGVLLRPWGVDPTRPRGYVERGVDLDQVEVDAAAWDAWLAAQVPTTPLTRKAKREEQPA